MLGPMVDVRLGYHCACPLSSLIMHALIQPCGATAGWKGCHACIGHEWKMLPLWDMGVYLVASQV